MLRDKATFIFQRLRRNANDCGALEQEYWLSCDEVICALTLLNIPSTLWMHSDALRVDSTLPVNSLILMQTAPECQLATPLCHLPHAVRLLPRLHFAHAHSHFFILPRAEALTEHAAMQLVQQTLRRCSQLSVAQLTWLCSETSVPEPSPSATTTPPPSSPAHPARPPLPSHQHPISSVASAPLASSHSTCSASSSQLHHLLSASSATLTA